MKKEKDTEGVSFSNFKNGDLSTYLFKKPLQVVNNGDLTGAKYNDKGEL